jgi:hypothetical protein
LSLQIVNHDSGRAIQNNRRPEWFMPHIECQ